MNNYGENMNNYRENMNNYGENMNSTIGTSMKTNKEIMQASIIDVSPLLV